MTKGTLSMNGASSSREGGMSSRERVESILRLDDAMTRYASSTSRTSFERKSGDARRERRRMSRPSDANETANSSNSRGSASAFALRRQPRRYDKNEERRRSEKGYFDDLERELEGDGRKKKRTKKRR